MCLITTQKEALVAEKDIIRFKVLEVKNFLCFKILTSPFFSSFKWRIYKTYKSNMVVRSGFEVHKGFHAYTTYDIAKINWGCFKNNMIFKAIIPAGSLYYVSSDTTEIVSDHMKIIKIVNN